MQRKTATRENVRPSCLADRGLELHSVTNSYTNGLQNEHENQASRAHAGAHTLDGLQLVADAWLALDELTRQRILELVVDVKNSADVRNVC
jgi:hypothetical protein